jgi:hypothetical protein
MSSYPPAGAGPERATCACGCGRVMIKSATERPGAFRTRRFANRSCANRGRPLPVPRLSERNQQIVELAANGIVQGAIRRKLGLSAGIVAGVLYRARETGHLPDLDDLPDTVTFNPFPETGRYLWPSSHTVNHAQFQFCGEIVCEAGGSWCAQHRGLVYLRPRTGTPATEPQVPVQTRRSIKPQKLNGLP